MPFARAESQWLATTCLSIKLLTHHDSAAEEEEGGGGGGVVAEPPSLFQRLSPLSRPCLTPSLVELVRLTTERAVAARADLNAVDVCTDDER